MSRWDDKTWVFDGKAIGAPVNTVTCIWDFDLPDGTTLFADQHSQLLHEARHFLWSLFSNRRNGRAFKASNAGRIFEGLRRLLKWMVEHNYACFGELNNRASERFCDWIVELYASPSRTNHADVDDVSNLHVSGETDPRESSHLSQAITGEIPGVHDEAKEEDLGATTSNGSPATRSESDPEFEEIPGLTSGTLFNSLSTWRYLWEQRLELTSVGVTSLQAQPFSGRSIYKLSLDLVSRVSKQIPALPDEIAISLMNAAHQFIETTSEDLIQAVEGVSLIRSRNLAAGARPLAMHAEVSRFLQQPKLSTPTNSAKPWPELFGLKEISSVQELRVLVDTLVDACTLIIQAETGMRLGEICALPSGWDEQTGLPLCVSRRPSKSGMLDLYFVKSKLVKNRPMPVEEEWLLAAAPRGTAALPDAVRAVIVVQKLLAPFRDLAQPETRKFLLVTLAVPRSFPTSSAGITEPSSVLIRLGQKQFAKSFVDWAKVALNEQTRPYVESLGECIRTHQWRKTYAQYVFQVDKRMLPAIARQFKHLSLAVTEGAYVGTSASLVSSVAEFNRNLTTDFFLANIRGTASKQEGRLAKVMAKYQPEMAKIIDGLADREARQAIDAWCRDRDMKIFFHGYGKCIPSIAPTEAECHKRAQTVHWANRSPNFTWREQSICTGCFLFLADQDNIENWSRRYVENATTWLEAQSQGRANEFRVAKARADQARTYLINLGAPVPTVEIANAR
ncbi:hypothetical protein [Massilia sp. KIM]|uniref:hypothetical protein n=1 Tax=Massilia sp. KIM TaxID=1955422 RepID=UPI00117E8AE8|nr:hypothetical protein [Massilia sp. KIM]